MKFSVMTSSMKKDWSHSFVGVRGLKFLKNVRMIAILVVALLRGGAWIEIALRSVAWKRA